MGMATMMKDKLMQSLLEAIMEDEVRAALGANTRPEFEAAAREGAILVSLALEHGIPLDVLKNIVKRNANGEPITIVGAVIDSLIARRVGDDR